MSQIEVFCQKLGYLPCKGRIVLSYKDASVSIQMEPSEDLESTFSFLLIRSLAGSCSYPSFCQTYLYPKEKAKSHKVWQECVSIRASMRELLGDELDAVIRMNEEDRSCSFWGALADAVSPVHLPF